MHLVVVEPLVVAQVKLLEHLAVLLSLVSLAKNFPEKKIDLFTFGDSFRHIQRSAYFNVRHVRF